VRRFCNSFVRESGADRFATAKGFDHWLRSDGRRATKPSAAELARIVAFRDALHTITVANTPHKPTVKAWAGLADLIADVMFSARPARRTRSRRAIAVGDCRVPRGARADLPGRTERRNAATPQVVRELRVDDLRRIEEPKRPMVVDECVRWPAQRSHVPATPAPLNVWPPVSSPEPAAQ
jgi:hypothetical protein